jgi:hypothetical protein
VTEETTEVTTTPQKPKSRHSKPSKAKASQRAKRLTPADLTMEDLKLVLVDSERILFNSIVHRALIAKKARIKEEAK